MVNEVYKRAIKNIVSRYKLYLSSTPRYARFMTDESLKEWVEILGPDVLLLTHADTTAKITEHFFAYNKSRGIKLTTEEKFQLLLAPWIHDWGEIVVEGEGIGDITFDKKNEIHEELETVIFNKVISLIESKRIKEKVHKTYQDVVMKRSRKIGEMFNAVERLGYLKTAIKTLEEIDIAKE